MTSGDAGAGRRELIDALVRSSFEVMAVLSRIGAEHDLSLTQLRVLGILRDRRIRMSELAGYLGLDKSTVSGLVDRAEKRGLVQRAPSPADGRAVDVFLTAAGTELAERGARPARAGPVPHDRHAHRGPGPPADRAARSAASTAGSYQLPWCSGTR